MIAGRERGHYILLSKFSEEGQGRIKLGAGLITSISIGIVSCLGTLGGFVPPLLLGWTEKLP